MEDKKLWAFFMAVVFFLGAFIAVLSFTNPFAAVVNSQQIKFPQEIIGMKMAQLLTGEEAMKSVNRLHGLDIKLKEVYIGNYGASESRAIIWISESYTTEEAAQQFRIMDEKMPNNKSFTGYERLNYKGLDLRYVYGEQMNMHNFYYLVGDKNYWIAVTPNEDLKAFLEDVLAKFPH